MRTQEAEEDGAAEVPEGNRDEDMGGDTGRGKRR